MPITNHLNQSSMKKQYILFAFGITFPLLSNAQWISQSTGFTSPARGLWDISIANENTVWAIAYDGGIPDGIFATLPEFTRTIDGGNTWITGSLPDGYAASNISAIDEHTAWISAVASSDGVDGAIFKTIDAGLTWNEQGVGEIFNASSYTNVVHFWNENDGIAIGDPNPSEFEIYTTEDGGTTWVLSAADEIPNPSSDEYGIFRNYCVLGDHIWFGTSKARIYHSSDKGITWTVSNTGITASGFDGIDFVFWSADDGIARRYNALTDANVQVVKTSDGGLSWDPLTFNGTFFGSRYGGIAYVPGTLATLVSTGVGTTFGTLNENANGSGSSYSLDGGENWNIIDTDEQHYIARFLNPSTGWAAGFSVNSTTGGIFKYAGNPLSAFNAQNGNEIYFNLYPNPTKGEVRIKLINPEQEFHFLSVIDLFGRKVLEENIGKPGEYFAHTLDLSRFSKGVYLLIIESNTYVHTEKIILD